MQRIGLFIKYYFEATHINIFDTIVELIEKYNFQFVIFYKNRTESILANALTSKGVIFVNYREATQAFIINCKIDLIYIIYDGETSVRGFQLAKSLELPLACSFQSRFDYTKRLNVYKTARKIFMIFSQADLVVCSGLQERDILIKKGIPPESIILNWPLFPDNYKEQTIDNKKVNSEKNIIVISRLVERKGVDISINVLKLLPKKYKLKIIGDGPLKEKLISLTHRLKVNDRVEFLGYQPLNSTLNLLSLSDILLHSPITTPDGQTESVSQVILMAFALKKAVVASEVGGISDLIKHNYNGYLCNERLFSEFKKSIIDLEDNSTYIRITMNGYQTYTLIGSFKYQIRKLVERLSSCKLEMFAYRKFFPVNHLITIQPLLKKICNLHKLSEEKLSLIGFGGLGLIFLTTYDLKRAVIKTSNPFTRNDRSNAVIKKEISREGNILRNNTLPFIPKLIYLDDKKEYIIREYIDGISLNNYVNPLRTIETRISDVIKLYSTCKELFKEAHYNSLGKYIIRDLKPSNLIDSYGNPDFFYLIDVGSIRNVDLRHRKNSKTRLGTKKWLYWSPELLTNEKDIDEKTDYFSFATTCYFLLVGKNCYTNSEKDIIKSRENYSAEYQIALQNLEEFKNRLDVNIFNIISSSLNPQKKFRVFG